jgi:6-phosphofructokinase 1
VYTPEDGIDLDTLRDDVRFLKTRYALDMKGHSEGRLVIRCVSFSLSCARANLTFCDRNESASSVYTTEVITKMLKEEGGVLFDSRSASLGHTLQGGIPSPMDRARAVRLSLKCMAFIEKHHGVLQNQGPKGRQASPESAAIITIQASSIKWVPVVDMVAHADMVNRRGKTAWWAQTKELVEALVGRPQLIVY